MHIQYKTEKITVIRVADTRAIKISELKGNHGKKIKL